MSPLVLPNTGESLPFHLPPVLECDRHCGLLPIEEEILTLGLQRGIEVNFGSDEAHMEVGVCFFEHTEATGSNWYGAVTAVSQEVDKANLSSA